MKKWIHHLRQNEKHLLVMVFLSISMVVFGAVLTGVDVEVGKAVIIISIGLMVYLLWFLGVDPIWKGFGMLGLAFGMTFVFSKGMAIIPTTIYAELLSADTVKGVTIEGVFFFVMIKLIGKWAGIEPYYEKLGKKKKEKEYGAQ